MSIEQQPKWSLGGGKLVVPCWWLATAEAQEAQIAAGHALTRVAAVITVTVPMDHSIADAAAGLRAAARGRRLLLRPLDLAQDAGFFAAVLPVGLGLESLRGRL